MHCDTDAGCSPSGSGRAKLRAKGAPSSMAGVATLLLIVSGRLLEEMPRQRSLRWIASANRSRWPFCQRMTRWAVQVMTVVVHRRQLAGLNGRLK